MSKYRICENKYGWYKIQRCQKEIKILGITFRKKWVDGCFFFFSTTIVKFKSQEEAQYQIDKFIEQDKMLNNKWTCI
jgi:hypothetical protein